jgi:hypothetical protein
MRIRLGFTESFVFGEIILREGFSMVELQAQNCVKFNS